MRIELRPYGWSSCSQTMVTTTPSTMDVTAPPPADPPPEEDGEHRRGDGHAVDGVGVHLQLEHRREVPAEHVGDRDAEHGEPVDPQSPAVVHLPAEQALGPRRRDVAGTGQQERRAGGDDEGERSGEHQPAEDGRQVALAGEGQTVTEEDDLRITAIRELEQPEHATPVTPEGDDG
ncbi:hypothetical protein [Georgenia sp. SUBG003]|uniref:hypothetical protein n=1 Tax=Georgenia sp. SUBG003 TaxID=1497974 RepID=UPI003AB50C40